MDHIPGSESSAWKSLVLLSVSLGLVVLLWVRCSANCAMPEGRSAWRVFAGEREASARAVAFEARLTMDVIVAASDTYIMPIP